jgi:hypothetical protein
LKQTLQMTSKYAGSHHLVACFWSREFTHINGAAEIVITK